MTKDYQAPESFVENQPFVDSILHPTDFTLASENAFSHALALSLIRQTKLTILHVGNSKESWIHFPRVRKTLVKWGHLKPDSSRSAVFEELNVRVEKISLKGKKPQKEVVDFLKKHPRDLVVLSTTRDEGVPGWIRSMGPEKIIHKANTMTLFIPGIDGGFVNMNTGEILLNKIIIPIDHQPNPYPAIEYALRTTRLVKNSTEIILFYAGSAEKMPSLNLPEHDRIQWRMVHQEGDVITEIIKAIYQNAVDLIVMATAGQHGFLDALRGSVTQQILRRVACPLLAVPVTG
jgi:nucleotide-binding universal stress UspA family protein